MIERSISPRHNCHSDTHEATNSALNATYPHASESYSIGIRLHTSATTAAGSSTTNTAGAKPVAHFAHFVFSNCGSHNIAR